MSDWYWNEEDDSEIICPYCGKKYIATYDETLIGDKCVDCYAEGDIQTVTCDSCGKKFNIEPYQRGWGYRTETIDGEMTEAEFDETYHK